MNLLRNLLAVGQSYSLSTSKSPQECLECIRKVTCPPDQAKPSEQTPLRGTVDAGSFQVHRASSLAARDLVSPVLIGTVTSDPAAGTSIKYSTAASAKYCERIYKNLYYTVGATAGLLISALLASHMVPKVYAGVLLVLLPGISLALKLSFDRIFIMKRDIRFGQDTIAKAVGSASWKDEGAAPDYAEPTLSINDSIFVLCLASITSLMMIVVLDQVTEHFWKVGDYKKVELITRPAADLTELVLGTDNLISEKCRFQLAEALRCETPPRFKEAQILYDRSIKSQCLQNDPVELANNLFSAGRVLDQTGRHLEADKDYREAVEKWPKGSDHVRLLWLARTLDRLAMLCLKEHKFTEAESFEKQALDTDRALGQESIRSVGEDLNDLAMVYDQQDEFAQAQKYYKEALEYKQLHPQSPLYSRATTLYNLAEIEKILGHQKQFEALSTEAYQIWKKILRFKADYSPVPKELKDTEDPGLDTIVLQTPSLAGPTEADTTDNGKTVPDPMDCYLRIMKATKSEYEEPHLNSRFDGLRPYSGRE
jgi:tetratricopeptide (TPR) repeat protein